MTELIHLTYEGNFQLENDAKVILFRVIGDEGKESNAKSDDADGDGGGKAVMIPVELQLDATAMHPQGGGQPTDTGTITAVSADADPDGSPPLYSAAISKVTIDRATGIVTHAGSISVPPNTSFDSDFFPSNTSVKVCVDAANRLLLSECHTAGHVVDAAMAKCDMLLPPTKGYHFLDGPYVEYKGSIDAKERDAFLERLKVAYQVRRSFLFV